MEINLLAIVLATAGQFAFGAVWYTLLFGTLWSKMHGFDKLSKAKQNEMMSQMAPIYVVQLLVTLLSTVVLAKLIGLVPDYSPYALVFLVWLGIALPAEVSAVIFGGTESKWMVKKVAVMVAGSLGSLLLAAAILTAF